MQTSTYPSNPNTAASAGANALKDTATAAKDFATSAKSDISNAAQTAVQSARDFANESGAAAAKRFDAASKWITTAAREKPLRSLGVAVAAGAILALFLGRR